MINSNIDEPNNIIMANDNTAKPTKDTTITKDPTTPEKIQIKCEICTFKCNYMKSLKMHMLQKHNKNVDTDDTDDSTEVTPAKNNAKPTSANNDFVEVTSANHDENDATSTSDNYDSNEVTLANNDDTPPNPDPTTNNPTNHTIPN